LKEKHENRLKDMMTFETEYFKKLDKKLEELKTKKNLKNKNLESEKTTMLTGVRPFKDPREIKKE
jgi:predicted transcriptional regulator